MNGGVDQGAWDSVDEVDWNGEEVCVLKLPNSVVEGLKVRIDVISLHSLECTGYVRRCVVG